jgi:hypothetical protein
MGDESIAPALLMRIATSPQASAAAATSRDDVQQRAGKRTAEASIGASDQRRLSYDVHPFLSLVTSPPRMHAVPGGMTCPK